MPSSSLNPAPTGAPAPSRIHSRRRLLAWGGAAVAAGVLAACSLTDRGGDDDGAAGGGDVATAAAQASAAGTALPFTGNLPVLGSQEVELNNGFSAEEPARVDLNAVTVTGGFTIVTFSVTSLSPDDDEHEGLYPTTAFSSSGGIGTTSGVMIIDALNQKTYETARNTDGKQLCSQPDRIRPGDTAIYYNMYAPLPENVETVTVSIPGLQLFTDVAVTR
ncbi:hypothetical protein [Actinomyces procaprae]|uniref:hypothetical protein n=1 Tax=Actinomyces procaprae TaxID=2560010 RepID=UPI00109DAA31|nr:hypothetical protein [Actinomyces procaprae]